MNRIEEMLNNSLEIINIKRSMKNAIIDQWPNVLITGLSGSGKTSITKQWAEDNEIILAPYDLSIDTSVLYEEDENGILRKMPADNPVDIAKQLIFDTLKEYNNGKDFILFLDDYHTATKENLEAIYYTMDTHKIVNPATGEEIELDNMLFTVAIKTDGLS